MAAGRGLLDFVAAPVRILVSPALFGGLGNWINPLAWLGLAALALPGARRKLLPLGVVALVIYASWFFTNQIARLLLPLTLLLALPASEFARAQVHRRKAVV